jgi:hypothetical protein
MYPWDSRADGSRSRPATTAAPATAAAPAPREAPDPATRAVQVALDRRDNGGDTPAYSTADTPAYTTADTPVDTAAETDVTATAGHPRQ